MTRKKILILDHVSERLWAAEINFDRGIHCTFPMRISVYRKTPSFLTALQLYVAPRMLHPMKAKAFFKSAVSSRVELQLIPEERRAAR